MPDKPQLGGVGRSGTAAVSGGCGIVPVEANLGRRLGGKSMSRRSGQCGSIERKGLYYVVRFWQDVAGQEKRAHRSVRICPVNGTGSMTKPERERRAREIINESGADTEEHFRQVQALNLGTTFRQQSEWWIKHVQDRKRRPVKPHTVTSWKSHLAWINPVLGDVPLSSVNNNALKDLVSKMSTDGFSPKSIWNYAQVVKMVVASAIGDDGEPLYPRKWNHEFIDLPDVAGQRKPVFTPEEIRQILSRAEGQYRVLYALLAASGLRIGEALALEVQHFAKDGTLSVCQGVWNGKLQAPKTKSGIREVDLPQNVTEMLAEFIGDRSAGFIFRTSNGNTLGQSNVLRRSLHPILAEMNREKAGFHSFRRFRVTHLRKQGTPEDLLRFWIGHSGTSVTDGYSKVSQDRAFRKEVAERVGIGFTFEVVPCCPPALNTEAASEVAVV
jgi:integrase